MKFVFEKGSSKSFTEWKKMEFPELSLAPTDHKTGTNSSSLGSESINPCRKRKFCSDHHASVDLQFKDSLPLDWEQCLDLESGRVYYLNRKTARKSWSWPKDQKLDLELNISCSDQSEKRKSNSSSFGGSNRTNPSSSNMVALACLNCHLLVILSKSSPSCPNCKYLHSLPFRQDPPHKIPGAVKSLSTLSLLN